MKTWCIIIIYCSNRLIKLINSISSLNIVVPNKAEFKEHIKNYKLDKSGNRIGNTNDVGKYFGIFSEDEEQILEFISKPERKIEIVKNYYGLVYLYFHYSDHVITTLRNDLKQDYYNNEVTRCCEEEYIWCKKNLDGKINEIDTLKRVGDFVKQYGSYIWLIIIWYTCFN